MCIRDRIYTDPQFERTVSDQTEFLVRNLLGGRQADVEAGAPAHA